MLLAFQGIQVQRQFNNFVSPIRFQELPHIQIFSPLHTANFSNHCIL